MSGSLEIRETPWVINLAKRIGSAAFFDPDAEIDPKRLFFKYILRRILDWETALNAETREL